MEQIIGLDIGDARTGIARSDPSGIFVSPIKTIESKNLIISLSTLFKEFSVSKVIVGLPKNMDGTEGEQAQKVRTKVTEIQNQFPELEIIFEDERLTSEAASEKLKAQGIKIDKENKHLIDMHAAAIILEQHFSNH